MQIQHNLEIERLVNSKSEKAKSEEVDEELKRDEKDADMAIDDQIDATSSLKSSRGRSNKSKKVKSKSKEKARNSGQEAE